MLLDTGGAIVHAKQLLAQANPDKKVLLHNVDILSNIDLTTFYSYAKSTISDVCLVVSKRITSRYFIFDDKMQLVGWINNASGEIKSPYTEVHSLLKDKPKELLDYSDYHLRAFSGIHLLNTDIISLMSSYPEKFSITDFYINSCKDIVIKGYEQSDARLIDVGKIDSLQDAETFIETI
jgi:NDP-sugar pyrophosphorylase family protein